MSCLSHDAALAAVTGDTVAFAAHAERYSRRKNDPALHPALLADAAAYWGSPGELVFYERPVLKRARQLRAGQLRLALTPERTRDRLHGLPGLRGLPVRYVGHHLAHAAGGYFTSPFREAAVVVADAIGEWDTLTVWHARGRELRRIHTTRYPHSLGLFYSAFTQRAGLKPNEEEYIFMGMAAYGEPRHRRVIEQEVLADQRAPRFRLRRNLHRGLGDWRPELRDGPDLAASVQAITEDYLDGLFAWVRRTVPCANLVYSGGVALNCLFNGRLARTGRFDDIWIMPNPGDAGSALGAALARRREFVDWTGPYLGHDIRRPLDPAAVARALVDHTVVGVANGRAEYGPRALGNRSLLADPRGAAVKERVNAIKRRQRFRPFAPIVLEERARDFFAMPCDATPYMQFVVDCRDPASYPAICHVDGTSRVQTVRKDQNPVIHAVITEFERLTGCPMLLNTSLNIRGMPLVNTWQDALDFAERYRVPVF
ncbi:carbamoyltransferase [Kitasatospora viridis]